MNLESIFPGLSQGGYRVTSSEDHKYNCVAWSFGDDQDWWEPGIPGYYWPSGVSAVGDLASYLSLYLLSGFVVCPSDEPEAGFEKVAVYSQDDEFCHVARQLPDGKWTSKLGRLQDIEHGSLFSLEGDEYGLARVFLKRPAPP